MWPGVVCSVKRAALSGQAGSRDPPPCDDWQFGSYSPWCAGKLPSLGARCVEHAVGNSGLTPERGTEVVSTPSDASNGDIPVAEER